MQNSEDTFWILESKHHSKNLCEIMIYFYFILIRKWRTKNEGLEGFFNDNWLLEKQRFFFICDKISLALFVTEDKKI